MNQKTVLIISYFALVIVLLVGVVLIAILAPSSLEKFLTFGGTLIVTASGAGVTFYMLGKQGNVIEAVKSQTNGTLSRLHETIAEKDAVIASKDAQLLAVVGNAPSVAESAGTGRHLAL
jgi:hypothetical protein